MRIISVVPSITEALFDFGLTDHEVVGRTKFCIHPHDKVKNVPRIGGTKNLNIEKIKELQPDLIIANKEENTKEQIEELQKDFKVWVTQISTIEDNYYLNKQLGLLLDKVDLAQRFNLSIYELFQRYKIEKKLKVAYLIWKNPYMSIGRDTFIHHILENMGFESITKTQTRYPEVDFEDLSQADLVFLSSEPYPFKEQDINDLKKHLTKEMPILLVEGEAFSWYGTHLAKCHAYFQILKTQLIESSFFIK